MSFCVRMLLLIILYFVFPESWKLTAESYQKGISSGLISSFGYSMPAPPLPPEETSSSGACWSSERFPPPLPLVRGPNCTRSATTSVRYFFSPLVLSSQLLVCMRPSTNTELPFFRYWLTVSACRPKTTTLWKSVCSCFLPSRGLLG